MNADRIIGMKIDLYRSFEACPTISVRTSGSASLQYHRSTAKGMCADRHVHGDLMGSSIWSLCATYRTPYDAAKTCAVQQYFPPSTKSIVEVVETGNTLRFH